MKKTMLAAAVAVLWMGTVAGQSGMERVTYRGHLYVETQVNGKKARLAFDTGAPYSCIDSTFLADSKLRYKNMGHAQMGGTGKKKEIVPIILNELTYTVAGKEYTSEVTPVIQLKPILGDHADGILGIDRLGDKVIAIDYVGGRMGFLDRAVDTAGYTAIAIRHENRRIYVPLTVEVREGKSIAGEALIDLGSGGTVTLTHAVAKRLGLGTVTPKLRNTTLNGGIGGSVTAYDLRARGVTLGAFTLNDITIDYSTETSGALSDKEYIAIVGNDFWERFDMIIDLPRQRLYLRCNKDFALPFESPTKGFGYVDRSRTLGCWVVNNLYDGSHAAQAGLRNGDRITAVDGRSVLDIGFEEQRNLFEGHTGVRLTVQRGDSVKEVAFDFDEPGI